jgi:tripartite-type tricarboxylate transporter receptor subunit TctC
MATIASMATNVSLVANLPYDPRKDFSPVTQVASQQLVLLVHPAVPAQSVAQLIHLAKAKPGHLTFASAGSGTGGHLSGELLKLLAGINMTHVQYKGVAPALVDVLSGQVNMTFPSIITGLPQIKSGRLRALAVTGAKRSPPLPELPTMSEAGVKGYESSTWYGVLGPRGMARPVVMKLNQEIVAVLNIPDVKEKLQNEGAEPVGNTPEQFGAFIVSEIVKWGKVFKAAGIAAQ